MQREKITHHTGRDRQRGDMGNPAEERGFPPGGSGLHVQEPGDGAGKEKCREWKNGEKGGLLLVQIIYNSLLHVAVDSRLALDSKK